MWTNLSQGEWSYCDANISSPLVSLVSIFFLRSNIPQVLYQRLLTVEAYSNNNWHSIGAIFTHALAYTRSRQTIGGSMIGQAWSLCYWVPDPRGLRKFTPMAYIIIFQLWPNTFDAGNLLNELGETVPPCPFRGCPNCGQPDFYLYENTLPLVCE